MRGRNLNTPLTLLLNMFLLADGPLLAQPKPTVAPEEYGKWESFPGRRGGSGGPALSADGRWLAYSIHRVNGEREIRLRALESGSEERVLAWGEGPVFSADNGWLAWTIGLSEAEREKLQKAEKPVRRSAGLIRLGQADERSFSAVSRWAFDETGRFLALLGYAPEEPKGQGAGLRILDLAGASEMAFGNVGDFRWSENGSLLALTIATGRDEGNGVQVYDAAGASLNGLDASSSAYSGLAWSENGADLAVLRSLEPASEDESAWQPLAWKGLNGGAAAGSQLDLEGALPGGLKVSKHRGPSWSEDGRLLAIGLRPVEKADTEQDGDEAGKDEEGADEKDEKLPGLQIWHTSDVRLHPLQKSFEERDKHRTLLAVWHLDDGRLVQLGSDLMEPISLVEGWRYAVERVSGPYPWGTMFGRPYHDAWIVDTTSGTRRRALEKVRYSWPSAGGRYLLSFDGTDYWTIELESGRTVNVTESLDAEFANTEYDTPTDLLPPHGVGGWLIDDAAVLLYDRFDVWRVAPDGSGGARITAGTTDEVIHRVVDIDPEEPGLDPAHPIYFSLRAERTEQRGYARLLGGDTAEQLLLEDKYIQGLQKAEDADVLLYRSEARDDSPDYFVTGPDLTPSRQVSDTNPFQSDYAWTRAELVDFKSESGRDLQAALLYPAGYEPGRVYPMIVYTYEILAPQIHVYESPSERDYYNFTAWTQHGYFVLMPDIVYTARDPGVSAIEAVRPAVRTVVERGLVDAARVGLIGHSWGGYQATYLPTRTRIFAASVAGAPLTDFVSFMGQMHWRPGSPELSHWETGQARMEVPFWEDPEAHRRNSPIHAVHEMETPLLMAFGDKDGTVDWDQGTEFFNFARRAGKQMVLLVYEGEDHGFRTEANQVDYHRRILEWFGHYLKGEPAPEWITSGIKLDQLEDEKRRVASPRTDPRE